ncbi:MAG: type II toxin-antitoxin system RelE/ParE family toxin [SAR202 cluster bacterium]|nr:type II toxin-antitoxin system RelE/ParE family toxin [SAR202 cluster bacterium]MDP6665295.1 type II toxin-antitoxin system RelE/ParE family toxin [SAR202 cluster bacterium]MDP6799013.1 type II toxin-antitoxin system RelE/ParE family toxin [SAR202 cluster bacterium]
MNWRNAWKQSGAVPNEHHLFCRERAGGPRSNNWLRVLAAIQSLRDGPRPRQSRKLVGSESAYRIRVASYRVLYLVDDARRLVTVTAVGHRRDVYR